MDEEIIADRDAEMQSPEKAKMRLGQRRGEGFAPLFWARTRIGQRQRIDAIGIHRRLPAIHKPMIEVKRIVEEIEENGLVIALEEMPVEALERAGEKIRNDAAAVRPAIDIVAEKDEGAPARVRARMRVVLDQLKQCAQQVEPPVNIAHGIEELTLGQRRNVRV